LAAASGMNADTFMKLFTIQVSNQNPMDPMNTSDFLNQFSQMTQVQTVSEMSKTMADIKSGFTTLTADSGVSKAEGMLGRKVQYVDSNGSLSTGTVDALQIQPDASLKLVVSGKLVNLANVNQVYTAP
jgi:flagellar basal-body rod modification protein FlgD